MTSAARALACVLALTACEGQRARLTTAGVSLGIAGYATYDIATRDSDPPVWLTAVAITGGLLGVLALLSGLDDEADRTPRRVTVRQPDRRDEAWALTQEAAAAARAGDCDLVKRINLVVHGVDRDFYDLVFLRDVAIMGCVTTEGTVSSSPTTPAPAPRERDEPATKPSPSETIEPRAPF